MAEVNEGESQNGGGNGVDNGADNGGNNGGDNGDNGAGEQNQQQQNQPTLTLEDLALADNLETNDGQEQNQNGQQGANNQNGDGADNGQQQQQQANGQQNGADNGQRQQQSQQQNQQQQQQQAEPPSFREMAEGIEDESLRNTAVRYNSLNDMAKAINDLRGSNRIKVPDENSTDEEKSAWRKALGVPEEATGEKGYQISYEEGLETNDQDQMVVDHLLPVAHKYGVPQEAVNGIANEMVKLSHEFENRITQGLKDYQAEQTEALKKEWGKDYEANINLAKRFAQTYADGDFQAMLDVKMDDGGLLGDHPVMQKFLANLGRRTSEGEVMIGNTTEERKSAQDEINELNKKVPIGTPGYADPAHQKKLQELYAIVAGDEPVVGAGGRTV